MLHKFFYLPLLLLAVLQGHSTVIYVSANAVGANNGSSWANAYTSIQQALSAAAVGDSIWVVAGIYQPGAARTSSYVLKSGVGLYGGFAGTETTFAQRDVAANVTTLSGDIGVADSTADNIYHILTGSNLNVLTTVDGFTIRDGNASGTNGGAMYMQNGKLALRNCSFLNNRSTDEGGAVYLDGESILLENCMFLFNMSDSSGAAMSLYNTDTRINQSQFMGNRSAAGSGTVANYGSKLVVNRCAFSGNQVYGKGSAITCQSPCPNDTIINSLFVGNVSMWGSVLDLVTTFNGCATASTMVANCTIAHNKPGIDTVSNTNEGTINFGSDTFSKGLYNTIIWDNFYMLTVTGTGVSRQNNLMGFPYGSPIVNPRFINPNHFSQAPFFHTGYDYHVMEISPAIDSGDSSYVWFPYNYDLDSMRRSFGGQTDVGCYEKQYCTFTPHATTSGDTVFCNGHTITLTATAGLYYWWNYNNSIYGFFQSITARYSGSYSLTMVDSNNCRGVTTVHIDTALLPVTVVGSDTFCAGQTVVLSASAGNTYHWSTGANTQSITVSSSGTYVVSISDANGCVSKGAKTVTRHPDAIPTIDIISPAANCYMADLTFTFNATNTGTAPIYLWLVNNISTGEAGTQYTTSTLNNGDAVKVHLTSNATCANPVSVFSLPVTALVYMPLDSPVITQTGNVLTCSPQPAYQWYKDSVLIQGATSQTFTITTSGIYTCEAIEPHGCDVRLSAPFQATITGVLQVENDIATVYPNPAANQLTISAPTFVQAIFIYTLHGQFIEQLPARQTQTLNISNYLPGVYIAEVKTSAGMYRLKWTKL